MRLIGICGFKGVGKDTVANLISRKLNKNHTVRKVAFADPLKSFVINCFNLNDESGYDQFKRCSFRVLGNEICGRDILRSLGGDLRKFDSDIFIEAVQDKIDSFEAYNPELSDNAIFIVTDLRYSNELAWLKENNAIIVKVVRDGIYSDGHETEQAVADRFVDYTINNSNDFSSLEKQVEAFVKTIV